MSERQKGIIPFYDRNVKAKKIVVKILEIARSFCRGKDGEKYEVRSQRQKAGNLVRERERVEGEREAKTRVMTLRGGKIGIITSQRTRPDNMSKMPKTLFLLSRFLQTAKEE